MHTGGDFAHPAAPRMSMAGGERRRTSTAESGGDPHRDSLDGLNLTCAKSDMFLDGCQVLNDFIAHSGHKTVSLSLFHFRVEKQVKDLKPIPISSLS